MFADGLTTYLRHVIVPLKMHKLCVTQLITTSERDMVLTYLYEQDRTYEFDLAVAMTAAGPCQVKLLRKVHEKYKDKWEAAYFLHKADGSISCLVEAMARTPYIDNWSDTDIYEWKLYFALVEAADRAEKKEPSIQAAMRLIAAASCPEEARRAATELLQRVGLGNLDFSFDITIPLSKIDKVFYINLDSRPDRRAATEHAIKQLGFPDGKVERVPGMPHEVGGIGCTASHLRCMDLSMQRGYGNVLILEDDFHPVVGRREFWETIDRFFRDDIAFDVIMLGYNLIKSEPHPAGYVGYAREAAAGSAYIVNGAFMPVLAEHIREGLTKFYETKDYLYTIDIQWMKLQHKSEWLYFKRRLSIQRPDYSNILHSHVNYGV